MAMSKPVPISPPIRQEDIAVDSKDLTVSPSEMEDEPPPHPKDAYPPIRLDIVDIPAREPHWKVTDHGEAIIPSPISVFPKPLALSYRNFHAYYQEHSFADRKSEPTSYPRVLVAFSLMSAMLRHYFPSPDHMVKEAWPGTISAAGYSPSPVVSGVPTDGTRYFTVQKKAGAEMVAIVVIVTEQGFLALPARSQPTQLTLETGLLDSRGRLSIQGNRMSRGIVLLLAAKGPPLKPTFEFYEFSSANVQPGRITPWIDYMRNSNGVATNIVDLAPENAGIVDDMFKTIVRGPSGFQDAPHHVIPSMPHSKPETLSTTHKAKMKPGQGGT